MGLAVLGGDPGGGGGDTLGAREARESSAFGERREDREAMVAVVRRYGVTDGAVLQALERVPRHRFVPSSERRHAYEDTPLPIGHGQTISQPYIVAEMTRLLDLEADSRVLEIGTGSGYQAAVLAEITKAVYTVEIVAPLAKRAAEVLRELGYDRVVAGHRDGYYGWPEHGPYDAIVVTCASGQIPPPLLEQLAPGGRMVIPVGPPFAVQDLMLVTKDADGRVRSRSLMAVRFVPLTRGSP
ncbi:MAG: protein-L-isoaspartate(D-aspartate) O-methyltransferase [Lentisphaeria bacterium]|nr:protein-L-isoaspartate(D-aspartate) O-methyltransferase [Lentisphaeria bacterium]